MTVDDGVCEGLAVFSFCLRILMGMDDGLLLDDYNDDEELIDDEL
jgi:hypothetical protein